MEQKKIKQISVFFDSIRTAEESMRTIEERMKELEEWIKYSGVRNNECTYYILGRKVCSNCECKRKPKTQEKNE